MKRKLKSILILMFAFVFMSLSFSNAKIVKATSVDDAVIGTQNLNKTPENSAKLGDVLNMPERGWKRYDDSYKNIIYEGNWYYNNENGSWNNGFYYSENNDSKVKFNFTGDKIRMITCLHPNRSKNIIIKIDGEVMGNLSQYNISNQFQTLFYENISLKNTEHFVEIYTTDNVRIAIDAIDIDANGELLPYEIKTESISLDKSSIDLEVGQTDKLTATVLPEDAANKKVIWSSSNESIAKVDENGNVTAVKEGQATITAKVENTDLTATCEVNVSKLEEENKNNAILSISLVNGATKEYDVSMEEVNKFINWYEERANGKGSALYSFDKKLNPYTSVKEYIVHDKIVSFEVREYEISK